MWMCMPSVEIPEQDAKAISGQPNPVYDRILHAYGTGVRGSCSGVLHKCAPAYDAEALALAASRSLLEKVANPSLVDRLIDCRSTTIGPGPAPTYRLAARVGLTLAVPLCLSGQKGTEVPQALFLLNALAKQTRETVAVVSSVQVIQQPDSRTYPDVYPLGDGAAAIIAAPKPVPGLEGVDILGVGMAQGAGDAEAPVLSAIANAAKSATLNTDEISWAVTHEYSLHFQAGLQGCLPNAKVLARVEHAETNFGCADTLISLAHISAAWAGLPNGVGLLAFAGRHGCVGAVLMRRTADV